MRACTWLPLLLAATLIIACVGPAPEGVTRDGSADKGPPAPIVESTGTIQVTAPGSGSMDRFTKEQVTLTTGDGVRIAATFYDTKGEKAVILLHQLNHDRHTWDGFAQAIQRAGYSAIALDFRGHGESESEWKRFTEKEFVAMIEEPNAAATFLRSRGKRVVAILGASIGANTAFRYSSTYKLPAVLLSPGLDYKGIDINNITSTAPTLIVVAEGDEYSASSAAEIEENNLFGTHQLRLVEGEAHGTYLLAEPGVSDAVRAFLDATTGQ